jgi:hypothetical protein
MLRPCLLIGLATSALAAGCSVDTGDSTILVLRNQAPTMGCVIPSDVNAAFFSGGVYDLGADRANKVTNVTFGYFLTPLVQNETSADVASQAQLGRRTFIVSGAHIDITFNDTNEFSTDEQNQLKADGLTHFDARFAGAVQPNGGLSAFGFEAVPAALMTKILAKHPFTGGTYVPFASVGMIVKMSVYGQMGGGTATSAQFEYPVTVCDECLLQNAGSCSTLPTSFMPRTGGACFSNQDGVTDCCVDAAGLLICPAAAPAPPA